MTNGKSDKPLIKAGFIGCGGHAWRNIYPALQFAPVDLIATCDLNLDRAKSYARKFGALRAYNNAAEMLEKEELDAVYIVTNYDEYGKPRFSKLAIQCMEAGCHAWIEKPPAFSSDEIRQMMETEKKTGKFVMVGFKKMFFPAVAKACDITKTPEFGGLTGLYVRYPQPIPPVRDKDPKDAPGLTGFLDHIVHPGSVIQYIAGPVKSLWFRRNHHGGGFAHLTFTSGATGCLHLAHGQSLTSPLERLEAVGVLANVVVDNGIKLTYYRPGERGSGGYSGAENFIGEDKGAPLYWEPEFSLGTLYNKGLFLIGYAQEVRYFANCVQDNRRPEKAHLGDALAILKLFEAFRKPEGVEHEV